MARGHRQFNAPRGAIAACIAAVNGVASIQCVAADVYVSLAADGSTRYASQPLDSSYAPLLVDIPGSHAGPLPNIAATERELRSLIEETARRQGVPIALVRAVVAVESGFRAHAVSPKGARGLMQLMPATGRQYGLMQPRDFDIPERNIEAGVLHLKHLLARHNGNVALALSAYNAGSGAVRSHGERIPPYRETMLYVPAVLSRTAGQPSP